MLHFASSPLEEAAMTHSTADRTEQFLRFSRTSLIVTLVVVLLLAGAALSLMLLPQGAGRVRVEMLGWWLTPVAIAGLLAVGISLRRRKWHAEAPEVRAVLNDEWRRVSLDLAIRWTLVAVLIAQFPFAWFLHLAFDMPLNVVMAMGTLTILFGLTVLITRFLYLDRG
jgi:hypothetical protein